jgi:inosine-uridine nucleoside N-ribohydrolase
MEIDNAKLIHRLEKPISLVDVVLDTDTFNEIDDQFALVYLIRSTEKLRLQAVYAAPFLNHHSASPEDGMERSFQEIFHVYELIDEKRFHSVTFRGAPRFLPDEITPVTSDAARDIVSRAMAHSEDHPLYVIGIAAATNIASAILMEPEIINRVVVLWLGGLAYHWHDNRSFNSGQDIAAARVLLDSGVPLVQFPGNGVVDHFHTSGPELAYHLGGKNAFCDYAIRITEHEAEICYGGKVWSRALWDVTPVGWLLDGDFMLDRLVPSPIMTYDHYYSVDPRRHFIKYVYHINRDNLMNDLFTKLARPNEGGAV